MRLARACGLGGLEIALPNKLCIMSCLPFPGASSRMARIPGPSMSSNASAKIDLWLAIGLGAGLYYFYQGFRTYREYRRAAGHS